MQIHSLRRPSTRVAGKSIQHRGNHILFTHRPPTRYDPVRSKRPDFPQDRGRTMLSHMMRNEAGGLVAALILVVTLPVTTRAEAISEGSGMADVVQNRIPEQTMTVGGIIIVGNETIPHDRILDAI